MAHHHKHIHSHRQTHTHSLIQTNSYSLSLSHTHSLTHSHTHAHRDMYKKPWICSAEEFLELYGKVEAVGRNCLLRWSGHLFEVTGTHLFDQSFCFKHISLFCSPIGAFFRWYPPFLCYTKDFTFRSGVILNPCISATNQDIVSQKFQISGMNRKYRSGQAGNCCFWYQKITLFRRFILLFSQELLMN